jgi:membrane protease YdiL (CAAX protease family)
MTKIQSFDRKSLLKGVLYLTGAVVILEGAFRLQNRGSAFMNEYMHITASPAVAALTGILSKPTHTISLPMKTLLNDFGTGIVLGSSMYFGWLWVAASSNWIQTSEWGWKTNSIHQIVFSILITTIGHFAVSINEEQVFRGYGHDVWSKAIGSIGATVVLGSLFTLGHRPKTLAAASGYFTMALLLTELRKCSNSLAMPIGYHWSWNISQLILFGHDKRASLRPITIDGPPHIVGTNSPESGWLMTLFHIGAIIISIVLSRYKKSLEPVGK